MVEYVLAFESGSKISFRPVKPPNGYGLDVLSIDKEAVPTGGDFSLLNVTLLFGSHGEFAKE